MKRTAKPASGPRSERVGERIKQELMDLFLRGEVHDPAVEGVSVSSVQVSPDLRIANVYVRLVLPVEESDPRVKKLLRALGRASGFLRREVGQRAELRFAPEMRFFWDSGLDHSLRIEELLQEIKKDEGK